MMMQKLPKIEDFKTPEGYFEGLPDQILKRRSQKPSIPLWTRYAAAAAIFLSIGTWIYTSQEPEIDPYLALDSEVNLYIESQYWTAEDILSFSENPDLILNEIIEEETIFADEEWMEENLF